MGKKNIGYATALGIAEYFLEKTRDLYRKSEIAGSLRRKEPIVHDIDFAVIPSMDDLSTWKGKLEERSREIGATLVSFGCHVAEPHRESAAQRILCRCQIARES